MSWPASFLSGPAAATGFAVINSCGSIGGFVGEFQGDRGPDGGFTPTLAGLDPASDPAPGAGPGGAHP